MRAKKILREVRVGDTYEWQSFYEIDGREVTEAEFDAAFPNKELGVPATASPAAYPIRSESAAVHPTQRQEAMDSAKNRGVPTYFDRHGRPEFTSRRHQLDYLKQYGMHNNSEIEGGASRTDKPPLPEYV